MFIDIFWLKVNFRCRFRLVKSVCRLKIKKGLKGISFKSIIDDSLDVYLILRCSCKWVFLENGFKILSFRFFLK